MTTLTINSRDLDGGGSGPSLRALVVHLRSSSRSRLLARIADLGVLVSEHEGMEDAVQAAYSTRSDFVIVVGNDHPAHAALAQELLEVLSSVLVVLLPAGDSADLYHVAGAAAVVQDDTEADEFRRQLAPALREARLLRRLGEIAADLVIGRDLHMRTMPPQLAREGRSIALTRVESEILSELARSRGKLVRTQELEQRLSRISSRAEIHGGYVKTVVLRIRRKIQEVGGDPLVLRNVRGIGYMLSE